MTSRDLSKIVSYWLEASEHDLGVAQSLFRTGKYDYCLFLCHLMIEKMLKAIVSKVTKDHPPYTHNLLYLAGKAELDLTKAQMALVEQINEFNLEIRYPEDLKEFRKKINRAYARKYFSFSKEIWKWLREQLNQL